MNMKKFIVSLSAVAFLILPVNSLVQAQKNKAESTVYDKAKIPSKTFKPAPLNANVNTLAAAHIILQNQLLLKQMEEFPLQMRILVVVKPQKKQINYIYAKAKIYVNGIYKTSASEGNYNSSHAEAQAFAGETWFEDGETYGT